MEGILLVNKPKGPTSFQIIKILKKITGERKIGHAGTLDPAARGLLIVLIGKATKRARYFQDMRKRYIARILLGVRTNTDDSDGVVTAEKEQGEVSFDVLKEALSAFSGRILQRPPRYSAVKYRGRRAYDLARQGQDFRLSPREVVIHDLRLIYYKHPVVKIELSCSKGTYVRSIARDLGDRLGSCAILHSLVRTQIGGWTIAASLNSNDIHDPRDVERYLIPIESVFGGECPGASGPFLRKERASAR